MKVILMQGIFKRVWQGYIAKQAAKKHPDAAHFICPVCNYHGPFITLSPASGRREHAQCPSCRALERHRLQYLVLEKVLSNMQCSSMSMLHVAPEPFFENYFRRQFGEYETADLNMKGVDHKVDLTALPFAAESYDFVLASHVLEHIPDDRAALSEISRIIKPGGVAILPVPLVASKTIEYPEPSPTEANHVRAPGYEDYFLRYAPFFQRIETYSSKMFLPEHQVYVYEDRSHYPSIDCPWRQPMSGERHMDMVPVCYR